MFAFLRSLLADSSRTSPASGAPRLGMECLEGRAVPAALIIETPPIVVIETVGNEAPAETNSPTQAPTRPPFTGTQAPVQQPFTDTQAPSQPPFTDTQAPTLP